MPEKRAKATDCTMTVTVRPIYYLSESRDVWTCYIDVNGSKRLKGQGVNRFAALIAAQKKLEQYIQTVVLD